jgi:hypothetical protein
MVKQLQQVLATSKSEKETQERPHDESPPGKSIQSHYLVVWIPTLASTSHIMSV